jgi:hypothetical protein
MATAVGTVAVEHTVSASKEEQKPAASSGVATTSATSRRLSSGLKFRVKKPRFLLVAVP